MWEVLVTKTQKAKRQKKEYFVETNRIRGILIREDTRDTWSHSLQPIFMYLLRNFTFFLIHIDFLFTFAITQSACGLSG
jgi:hypothetical protein